jgi:inosine-uridine nucleoside N-ribohydrolase
MSLPLTLPSLTAPMGPLFALCLLVAGCAEARSGDTPAAAETVATEGIAFVGLNVIPMDRERVIERQTVMVQDGSITAIGRVDQTQLPDDVVRVEGEGRYLMPGLAGMHGHLPGDDRQYAEDVLFLYVSNGVTLVRGMAGHPSHLELRDRVARGELIGPTIFAAGPSFGGNNAATAEAAERLAREQRAAGYDLLKVAGPSHEGYQAMARTSHELGIPLAGHIPADVGIEGALAARQASVDHLDRYVEYRVRDDASTAGRSLGFFGSGLVDLVDTGKIPGIVAATRDSGVWNVPTLSLVENLAVPTAPEELIQAPGMRYNRISAQPTDPEQRSPEPAPVRVIFDTDMDTDCDDAGALGMLHALADAGEVEILATVVSSHYPYSAAAVDVINIYYGRPDLPIGVPKQPGASIHRGSRYARQIAAEFPHRVRNNYEAEDAVAVYRRILAGQPDTSVVIVTVGYVTNIRYLLESGPDEWSPLSGLELVRQRAKSLIAMGGGYPAHTNTGEWGNFKPDPIATNIVVRSWPRPLIFAGDEIGDHILTGAALADTPPTNPVRRTYELYLGGVGRTRPSWDQTAVLFAIRPNAGLWEEVGGHYNRIFPDGTNEWVSSGTSSHTYLIETAPPEEITHVIEELMSRPPRFGTVGAPR